MRGGAGNDSMGGGNQDDTLTGGAGGDRFVFGAVADSSTNCDQITDFSHSEANELIKLNATVFTAFGYTGTLNASNFKAGTAAADADDYIVYNIADGSLYYDADGNSAGAQVKFAILDNLESVDNTDFSIF